MSSQTKTVCLILGATAAVAGLCVGGFYLFKKFGPKCAKKQVTQDPAEEQPITEGQEPETKTEEEEKKDN